MRGIAPMPSRTVVTIDSARDVRAISPFIYGTNAPDWQRDAALYALTRSGGNRLTAYNWENNASNAGTDYLNQNDGFLDTVTEEAAARFGDDCLNQRDIIYTEWAAFIDYLVEEHGRERLYSLFRTPPLVSDDEAAPFRRPNFPAVYGSSLERLEAAWLERLTQ